MTALVACGSRPPTPSAPPPPAPDPVLTIASDETVSFTKIADGSISAGAKGQVANGIESPIVAMAASADVVALLIRTDRYVLRLATAGRSALDVPLGLDYRGGSRLEAVAIADSVARVAIQDADAFALFTVDLAKGHVISRTALQTNTTDFRYDYLAPAPGGWIVAGYRTRAGQQTDPVTWFAADDAKAFGEPFSLVTGTNEHQHAWIHGAVAPDGSALISAVVPVPGQVAPQNVLAVRRSKTWKAVGRATGPRALTFVRVGETWFLENRDNAPPAVEVLDPSDGSRRTFDASWAQPGRTGVALFSFNGEVVIYGGETRQQSNPTIEPVPRRAGAIYDIKTGNVRTFTAPTIAKLPDTTWKPNLVMSTGDELCLLGGSAYSTSPVPRAVHGAACLDRKTLTWRWLAVPPIPESCGPVGTSFVLCGHREHWHVPASGSDPDLPHATPAHDDFGPYEWSLWRVRVPPQGGTRCHAVPRGMDWSCESTLRAPISLLTEAGIVGKDEAGSDLAARRLRLHGGRAKRYPRKLGGGR